MPVELLFGGDQKDPSFSNWKITGGPKRSTVVPGPYDATFGLKTFITPAANGFLQEYGRDFKSFDPNLKANKLLGGTFLTNVGPSFDGTYIEKDSRNLSIQMYEPRQTVNKLYDTDNKKLLVSNRNFPFWGSMALSPMSQGLASAYSEEAGSIITNPYRLRLINQTQPDRHISDEQTN